MFCGEGGSWCCNSAAISVGLNLDQSGEGNGEGPALARYRTLVAKRCTPPLVAGGRQAARTALRLEMEERLSPERSEPGPLYVRAEREKPQLLGRGSLSARSATVVNMGLFVPDGQGCKFGSSDRMEQTTGSPYLEVDTGTGSPYKVVMHTVIETHAYLAAADDAGMTEDERQAAIIAVAHNPAAGDLMPGTGGCRKLRVAGKGKGKSGGYRVIHYYGGLDVPVFLLTVFSKGERANLSRAECNALQKLTRDLVKRMTTKVVAIRRESRT